MSNIKGKHGARKRKEKSRVVCVTFQNKTDINHPPPHPSCHLHFLLSPSCQVEVESDPAKLISDNSSSENYNQGTKFETLKKPIFSLFDVIIFLFNGIIKQNI